MLVATVHAVQRAVARLRAAQSAALSLGQQQRIAAVADDLQTTAADLRTQLDDQGHCILGEPRTLREKMIEAGARMHGALAARKEKEATSLSWTQALADAIDTLGEEADQLADLASAQSAGTPAGAVGRETVSRLRMHRGALLGEVARLRRAA
ncbi:MAG: hypothetical protein HKN04_05585 [Rhodothermaceae bacterium]|nr:hypothetical protein [Rhodothermaceae bacterium]